MSTWMRRGGDNYQMFLHNRTKLHPGEDAVRLVAEYIDYATPIVTGIEERIVFVKKPVPKGKCTCDKLKKYCSRVMSMYPSKGNLLAVALTVTFFLSFVLPGGGDNVL
eukprot:gene2835-3278_t